MKPTHYIDKGTYKEIIRDDKLLFKCPYCGKWYRALAYHTRQAHNISSKQLKKNLGLKSNYQLITPELKEKHKEIALYNDQPEKLRKAGEQTRYKKEHKGHTKDTWSNQAISQLKQKK